LVAGFSLAQFSGMKSLSLRRRVYLSFLAAALLLVAVSTFFGISSRRYAATVLEVEHTQARLRQLETVLSLAKDAETGERGYVITRQEPFLEPYHLAQANLQRELAELDALVGRVPFHAPRLCRVRALAAAQARFLSKNVTLERQGQHQAVVARVMAGEGKRLLDTMRGLVAQMQAHERGQLKDQLNQVQVRAQRNNAATLIGLVVLVGLFGVATRTISRDLKHQEALEAELSTKNEVLGTLNTSLQRLLNRLYEAQQMAQVGSFDLSADGTRFTGSPELYRIHGWNPAEAGQSAAAGQFAEVIHPDDRARVLQQVQEALHNPAPYFVQYRIVRADGITRYLEARGRPVREGDVRHFQGTVMDVTERELADQQLTQLNQHLQATNDELSAALEELSAASHRIQQYSAALEQQNEDLEAFSYSVSHDLKTPLRSVLSFGSILEDEYSPVLDAEGRRLLDIVLANARAMHELIEALLQFARLGRTAVRPEPVDLDALVRELLAEFASGPDPLPVLELAPLGTALADRRLIRQVWFNLLGNAIKFTALQPQPRLRVYCQPGPTETVYTVADNGIGFDTRHAGELFGVFQRLPSAVGFAGTGVGLAICQRILANHGGRIWAEGAPNEGATFYFTLPATPAATPLP
jgi:PAS domain S-box-containing protein